MSDARSDFEVHAGTIYGLRCAPKVRREVGVYARRLMEALGDDLVGIYLYGSLPWGCFHRETSDVDVVVVTEGPCSEGMVSGIVKAHEETDVPVDATFVTRSQIEVDETPTPIEFVVKPDAHR